MSIDFLHEEKKAPRLRHVGGGWTMALRIRMPGGTLKVKTYRELRDSERDRRVPVWKLGAFYVIWSSGKHVTRNNNHSKP
ncbi:MAG: hypothetical protein E5V91_19705 [Mesorhizobium sp.]|nr:hypothetical protein EN873_14655 [bacterium M00.F.Ca.ET.230.01.1.1]TIV37003.1 MAG: hypothetical protein E5V91_19705 [Mesorhizobium sp.]